MDNVLFVTIFVCGLMIGIFTMVVVGQGLQCDNQQETQPEVWITPDNTAEPPFGMYLSLGMFLIWFGQIVIAILIVILLEPYI